MGGTIAAPRRRAATRCASSVVTDGSSTQYPGDAEIRAQKEDEALRAAAELGVTDYVHLDLPDMRLDTLPHVEVNRVVEEHVADFAPQVVYTPHPDVNRDHRVLFDSVAVATRPTPGPARPARSDVRADLEHGVDAGAAQLVRPELVRRHRRRRIEREGRGLRALRDGGARLPTSAQRARDSRRRRVLRCQLRLRARRAVRARARSAAAVTFRAVALVAPTRPSCSAARSDGGCVRGQPSGSSSSEARSPGRRSTACSRPSASARATSPSSRSCCGAARRVTLDILDKDTAGRFARSSRPARAGGTRLVHVGRARQPRPGRARRASTVRAYSSSATDGRSFSRTRFAWTRPRR